MSYPEVVLGPQDPDATSDLTARLGTHNKAGRLLERHAKNYGPELTRMLSLPLDEDRSEVAREFLDETRAAALSVTGRKRFLKEEHSVEDVSVRRDARGREEVLAITYRVGSGRSARGVISYASVPEIEEEFLARQEEAEGGKLLPLRTAEARPEPVEPDERVEELESQLKELSERLSASEAAAAEASAPKEPFEGYEADHTAAEIVTKIKEDGAVLYGVNGLHAIADYEEAREGGPRKSVVNAARDLADDLQSDGA